MADLERAPPNPPVSSGSGERDPGTGLGRNLYFWATQSGAELDLLILLRGERIGIEVNYSDAPGPTKSMRVAIAELGLRRLFIVYPGRESYTLGEKVAVVPLEQIKEQLAPRHRARGRRLPAL
jgi:predicted AAA+ superfamily ATPase